jgi:hypothetical protein
MPTTIIGCECDKIKNSGYPDLCQFGVPTGMIVQSRFNSNGTENKIDLNVASITTEWSSLLTQVDKTQRLFPYMGLRQFAQPTADDVYVTDNQGIDEFVRKGDVKFTFEKWNSSPILTQKINDSSCVSKTVYHATSKGVIGLKVGNDFQGIPASILRAKHEMQVGDQPSKTMINGQFAREFEVGQLWFVSWEDLNTSYNAQKGLQDATITVKDAPANGGTNTVIGLKMRTDYGQGLVSGTDIKGVVLANLSILNVTTNTAITGVSLTEVEGEKYTLTYPSATTADVIRVSFLTTTGYEGKIEFAQVAP